MNNQTKFTNRHAVFQTTRKLKKYKQMHNTKSPREIALFSKSLLNPIQGVLYGILKHFRLELSVHKKKFQDDSFPPKRKSIWNHRYKQIRLNWGLMQVYKWLRPEKINGYAEYKDIPWALFRNPSPSDVIQGGVGNCWFISALAVLAKTPKLLENLFVSADLESGRYTIRLCKDGQWVNVTVDDLLPCNWYRELVFAKGIRKQLWVPLIEKAAAKLHNSYQALKMGNCAEALTMLTGYPCDILMLTPNEDDFNYDVAWERLLSFKAAGFPMGASTRFNVPQEEYLKKGLNSLHLYSILDVNEACGLRLVQLRNPWGYCSWNGDWSDKSACWTLALRNKLKAYKNAEGIFWMCFEDMCQYFYRVEACKVRPLWNEYRLSCSTEDGKELASFLVTIEKTTEIDFAFFVDSGPRKSVKTIDRIISIGTAPPTDLCLTIFSVDANWASAENRLVLGPFIHRSERQVGHHVECSQTLEPGKYIIVPLNFSGTEKRRSGTLVMHSSQPIVSQKIPQPDNVCIEEDAKKQLAIPPPVGEPYDWNIDKMSSWERTANFIVINVEGRHVWYCIVLFYVLCCFPLCLSTWH